MAEKKSIVMGYIIQMKDVTLIILRRTGVKTVQQFLK